MKTEKYYVRVFMHYVGCHNAVERDYSGRRHALKSDADAELREAEKNPYVVTAWIDVE